MAPLDQSSQAFLKLLEESGLPALNDMSPEDARAASAALAEMAGPAAGTDVSPEAPRAPPPARPERPAPAEAAGNVETRAIPAPAGEIPVRIYRPEGSGPFPVLVYYHGGGWVIGSLDSVDSTCRMLCNRAQCVVVSVDYRLAPEHKFPAAADDCYAATKWVANHAAELNADPDRLAVGGDSAGGNLAAVMTLMARDRGGPRIVYQMLIYPVTLHGYDTPSYTDN